jgi:hypothetical protein
MLQVIWAAMLGMESPVPVPVWAATCSILGALLICLWLLARRVRAYEVVRG